MLTRPGSIPVPGLDPDTGVDARALIQSALDTLGYAYLPPGVYYVDTPAVRAPHEYAMLQAIGKQVYGDGPATVLRFRGSAGMQDWRGIELGGEDAWIADIAIDTSELTATSEQTHAIHTIGPAARLTVTRCTINHPIRGAEKGGDAIQLVGYDDGRLVVDVLIDDNDIIADRSAVGVHSGTSRLVITNNRTQSGNTDFDFEGSGDTSDVEISGNTCSRMPGIHGVGALQLQKVARARVFGNRFEWRGVDLYERCIDIEIYDNRITQSQTGPAPVISIAKDCTRVDVHDNTMIRAASAGAGTVIFAGPHGSGTPSEITIRDNTIIQQCTGQPIQTAGVVGLNIVDNTVVYTGGGAAYGLIANGSSGAYAIRTDQIRVEGNTWLGVLKGIIGISGSYAGCGSVEASENYAPDAVGGIVGAGVTTGAGILGPVTSTHDAMPAPAGFPPGFVVVTF